MELTENLFQGRTFAATWWRPEDPDDRHPGHLTYDPVDGLKLKLQGRFAGVDIHDGAPHEPVVLHGSSYEGRFVLEQCIIQNVSTQRHHGVKGTDEQHQTAYLAGIGFQGDWLPGGSEPAIHSVAVSFTAFEEWIDLSPYSTQFEGEKTIIEISESEYEKFRVECLASDFALGRWSSGPGFGSRRELMADFRTMLWIEPDAPQRWQWFNRVIHQLEGMMTVLSGRECVAELVSVPAIYDGDDVEQRDIEVLRSPGRVEAVEPQMNMHMVYAPPGHPRELDAAECIRQWLAVADETEEVQDLLAAVMRSRTMFLNVRFSFLVQALESWHRQHHPGTYMEPDGFDQARKALAAAIPDTIQGDHRVAVRDRLKYANEFSLGKRLNLIWESLPRPVQNALRVDNPADWRRQVKDTRNYFSHYDPSIPKMSWSEIARACIRLQTILSMLILRRMGLGDFQLGQAARRSMAGWL